MRVLWLLTCITVGLISPAEANLRAASPMMGDGVPRTGPAGPAGPQGEPGPNGDKGDAGSRGEPGPQGERGISGEAGTPGPAGQRGADGLPGPQGNPGPQGLPGSAGRDGAKGDRGDVGPKGDLGGQGAQGAIGPAGASITGPQGPQGVAGPTGAPKRVERYTATSTASATTPIATFTWTACITTPDVDIIPTWSGDQMIVGVVVSQTLTGATVAVKRSRGTLLLTAGPFEPAPSTAVTVRVICN